MTMTPMMTTIMQTKMAMTTKMTTITIYDNDNNDGNDTNYDNNNDNDNNDANKMTITKLKKAMVIMSMMLLAMSRFSGPPVVFCRERMQFFLTAHKSSLHSLLSFEVIQVCES